MATEEKYTTVIQLNSTQAKHELEELRKKVDSLKSNLSDAKAKCLDKSFLQEYRKNLREAQKELKKYDTEVVRTIDTMGNLEKASVKQIEQAQKSLKRLASEVPHDSLFFEQLNGQLDMATQELENIKAVKAFEQLQREATGAAKSLQVTNAEAQFVKTTVENIDTASLKQLKIAEQTARGIMETQEHGNDKYKEAAAHLDKIKGRLSEIDAQERKVVTLSEQYNQAMMAVGQDAKVVRNETELIDRTLSNLNTASIRDMEYSIKALKEHLQDAERSGADVENLTEKIKKLNTELRKVQDMQAPDKKKGNIFSRGFDFLNKNWGAFTQIIAGYIGVREVIKGSVEEFAKMDQAMNNVRKYTGQTIEEVERMNEAFKKMDTRTPREQLNELAGSAGRLGITATSAVEEYVDAADKINVALGDDLGEGAVDKIGKLAMAFGEDDKKGLRNAMLATGSAVNDLAQKSAANAGYLVEFTARLSGVGMQAGLTQSQILGLGAAMDENMQKDEMASTAISQIITKMTTDSEVFARIAGKNVEEFSNLVRTDMNAALLEFFDAMNKKGGFTELAPLFDQMGLDGTRAIGVLSTLASKIDDVRKHQQTATEAYEKGTSVIEEFNVQNSTYQAQLDKARKAFADLRIELGEKLLPVASVAIGTTSMLVRSLKVVVDFVTEFRTTLTLLTLAIAALTAAKYKDIIASKLMAFWNDILVAGFKKLYAVVLANPWTAATLGVTALIGVVADLTRKTQEASKAQKVMTDIEHDATVKAETERDKIERLTKKIHDNSLSIDERRRYIEELQKIVPDYVAKISEEGRVYEESTEALDKYIRKIKEEAMVAGAKSKMEEMATRRAEYIAEKMRLNEETQRRKQEEAERQRNAANSPQTSSGAFASSSVHANMGASAEIAAAKSKMDELDDKIALADKTIDMLEKVAEDNVKSIAKDAGKKTEKDSSNYDTRSYWEAELKSRREKLKALREDAKATAADIEKANQAVQEAEGKMETFTGAKAAAKLEHTQDKLLRERLRKSDDAAKAVTEEQLAELTHRYAMGRILYCDYIDEQERIQLEGIERRMLIYGKETLEYQKLNRQREELLLNGSEESRKLTLQEMKHGHEQRLALLEETAWRENMTEQQKNEMIFNEDMRFMDEQRILYRKGTLERINLDNEIEARQQQHRLETEQYYQQQLDQVREQYLNKADTKAMELSEKHLKELHARNLLSKEEYYETLLALKAQYASYETGTEHDQRVGANAYKVAQDKAKQELDNSGKNSANLPFVGDIMLYKTTMEQLKAMYQSDEITHAQYLAAKQQATATFCEDLAQKMQAAYQSVNQVMSAASSYFSAQQEYETTLVQKKYEKQIEAAGNNQKKVKKLQEKQQKEEAAIKTKYARKAAAIQMAQAVAQTAISAINAYSSAAAIPVVGHILAPVAAAAALAAGMLQIATIKKQQQAQQAGYYEGGFTGGRQYRREAGVVHEGEFVANHQAVNNPAIMPVLNFLDQAQRNNTVGSLTAADVSRSMGGVVMQPQVVAPVVNVQTDNEALKQTITDMNDAIGRLNDTLQGGIEAPVYIDGEHGVARQLKRYENLMKNK